MFAAVSCSASLAYWDNTVQQNHTQKMSIFSILYSIFEFYFEKCSIWEHIETFGWNKYVERNWDTSLHRRGQTLLLQTITHTQRARCNARPKKTHSPKVFIQNISYNNACFCFVFIYTSRGKHQITLSTIISPSLWKSGGW